MPRHRSLNLQKFIDSLPESLLEEYFTKPSPGLTPPAYNYDSINKFLDEIPDENLKSKILEDFTHINDICEKTMNYVVRAYHKYGIRMPEEAKKEEMAMDLFLHHAEAFDYAYDYYCLYKSTSKMSHHNIESNNFQLTDQKINLFKQKVSEFYSELAKGQECIIRYHDDEDQAVIVVIHGSYKRSLVVWEGQQITTKFFRPANEDILQFDKKKSVLSLKAPYKKDKENYIACFTSAIIEDETQEEREDRDVTYTLEPLQNGTFNFEGNEVITDILLLEIKLAMRGSTAPTIKLKSSDIRETLDKDISGVRLDSGELVHAKFKFTIELDNRPRNITFEITPPNVTDLTKQQHADIIADYLKENGVKLV
ncbi:MAG: hypothetical protein V1872_14585 [bacterium]